MAAGFLDEVVEPERLMETALAKAEELAGIAGDAYATIKQRMRGAAADQMLRQIAA